MNNAPPAAGAAPVNLASLTGAQVTAITNFLASTTVAATVRMCDRCSKQLDDEYQTNRMTGCHKGAGQKCQRCVRVRKPCEYNVSFPLLPTGVSPVPH